MSGILCWTLAHRRHRDLCRERILHKSCMEQVITFLEQIAAHFHHNWQNWQLCSGDDASFGLSDGLCLVHTRPLSSIAASGPGGNCCDEVGSVCLSNVYFCCTFLNLDTCSNHSQEIIEHRSRNFELTPGFSSLSPAMSGFVMIVLDFQLDLEVLRTEIDHGQDCWGPSHNDSLQPLADRMRSMLLTAPGAQVRRYSWTQLDTAGHGHSQVLGQRYRAKKSANKRKKNKARHRDIATSRHGVPCIVLSSSSVPCHHVAFCRT